MRTLFLTLLLAVVMTANAVPARRYWRTITQPDGTTMKVMLIGDEHFHYYVDEKQNAYSLDTTGYLKPLTQSQLQNKQQTAIRRARALAPVRRTQQLNPISGTKKTLLILVNFTPTFNTAKEIAQNTFSPTLNHNNPKATFDAICNQVGYTNSNGAIGSVHDYFMDQSYNKFDLHFDVVGPVTVSHAFTYYGADGARQGDDMYPDQMVREAVRLVKDSVNFADYDWDGDGEAEQVICIYAGYGQATGGGSSTIWPHQSELRYTNGGAVRINGTTINKYLVLNERVASTTATGRQTEYLAGIGVLCHEFSHSLGLMDHYDTQYSGNLGMGSWDLMDQGSYGGPDGNGWVPASYTAYERMYLGWLTPTELYNHKDSIENMPYLQDSPDAYIIYNKNHSDEYFMLENKSLNRWDSYLPNSGLLVTHIDYDQNAWEYNYINSGDEERMTVVPADGSRMSSDETSDTYPYAQDYLDSNSFELHNRAQDGTYNLYCSIQGIKVNDDGTINFGYVPDPRYAVADGINKIKVNEAASKDAVVYNLAGQRVDQSYNGIVISNGKKYFQKGK